MTAREATLEALTIFRKGGKAEAAIDALKLESREAALAKRLCTCVLQNALLIDNCIEVYSNTGVDKMQYRLLDILRISIAQILFFERVPNSAAVNEGVELTKRYVNKGAAGLANAILRRIAEHPVMPNLDNLPPVKKLSVLYSCPMELTEYYVNTYGMEETAEILRVQNEIPPVYAHVNTMLTSPESLLNSLDKNGIEAKAHPWLKDEIIILSKGSIENISEFRDGLFFIQDPAAALAVEAASPCKGMTILDGCASPGGKSFAAAIRMKNSGMILSRDINEKKTRSIIEGAKRLKINIIYTEAADARAEGDLRLFDIVLADVPCSGFGTVRKKPEIRYKKLSEIAELPGKQLAIINNLAKNVKPGGVLLYSTCTLIRNENDGVITQFLEMNKAFAKEAFELPAFGRTNGSLTMLPQQRDTDGFYICKLRKKD